MHARGRRANETGVMPGWRSILFVPADNYRFIAKAHLRGADAILLDLEDSVAPGNKEMARAGLTDAFELLANARSEIGVRINRPLGAAIRDIEAAVQAGARFLSLPKVESAEHVRLLSEHVGYCEASCGVADGAVRFLVNIESASALMRAAEIADADRRVVALVVGPEDLSESLGCEPTPDTMLFPRQLGLIAARAAGILPVGLIGSNADFSDLDAFRDMAQRARRFGFECGAAIHPSQIPALNAAFSISPREMDEARALLARSSGHQGAFADSGKMIDEPVLARARRLLERAAAHARLGGSGTDGETAG